MSVTDAEQLRLFEEAVEDKGITTQDLDKLVDVMARAKSDYESKKAISDEAYHYFQQVKGSLVGMLQAANKSKYSVDGIGTVSVTEKLKVRTPKDFDSKEKFFAWLKDRHGKEGFLSYLGINYQSLQKLYNDEFAQAVDEGHGSEFSIPGIETPEAEVGLSFRKS